MTQSRIDLTGAPIPQLIRKVAFPASVGFFCNTMFNVVDTWFAGRLNTDSLAALGLSLSLFFVIIALGSGLSTGATALMGEALGKEQKERAGLLAVQGVVLGSIAGVLLAFVGVQASPLLFAAMGAKGDYLEVCLRYMNPIFMASPVFVLSYMFNAVLQTLGDTKSFRNTLVVGVLLDIVLDPWFMWGGFGLPAMGIIGISLSTVAIQIGAMSYLLWKARRTGLLALDSGHSLVPRIPVCIEILRQGFPAAFSMFTIGLGFFVATYFASSFGQEAVAAFGTVCRIEQIAFMPAIGLGVAALSITAQNYGAGRIDRVTKAMRTTLIAGAWFSVPGFVCMMFFPTPLMQLFTIDSVVVHIGAGYLPITALALYGYVIIFVCQYTLQGVQHPVFPMVLGVMRQLVAPLLLFTLMTRVLDLGINSLWWTILGIIWTSATLSLLYSRHVTNKLLSAYDQTF